MPVRQVEKVVQVRRHARGAPRLGAQHRHEQERLGRRLHRGAGEYAARAQELERLDLDCAGGGVEVPREDDLGDGEGRGRGGGVRGGGFYGGDEVGARAFEDVTDLENEDFIYVY